MQYGRETEKPDQQAITDRALETLLQLPQNPDDKLAVLERAIELVGVLYRVKPRGEAIRLTVVS